MKTGALQGRCGRAGGQLRGHEQRVIDRHLRARADAIDGAQRLQRQSEPCGHLLQRFPRLEPVRLPGDHRLVRQLQLRGEQPGLVVRQQDRRLVGARDHRTIMLRIERKEFLQRHVRKLGRDLDVHLATGAHDAEVRRVGNVGELEPIGLRVPDDVFYRLQLGHIAARLRRHLEAQIIGRQLALRVGGDRPPHRSLAPVVRREGEVPIPEFLVELFQIIERAIGRGNDVAPLVEPPVLFHAVDLAGRRHELPDARGAASRIRHRIECAFDHRQQRDLHRHPALFHLPDDVVQVAPAALDHPRDVLRIAPHTSRPPSSLAAYPDRASQTRRGCAPTGCRSPAGSGTVIAVGSSRLTAGSSTLGATTACASIVASSISGVGRHVAAGSAPRSTAGFGWLRCSSGCSGRRRTAWAPTLASWHRTPMRMPPRRWRLLWRRLA